VDVRPRLEDRNDPNGRGIVGEGEDANLGEVGASLRVSVGEGLIGKDGRPGPRNIQGRRCWSWCRRQRRKRKLRV
jgi:hypothetical protein